MSSNLKAGQSRNFTRITSWLHTFLGTWIRSVIETKWLQYFSTDTFLGRANFSSLMYQTVDCQFSSHVSKFRTVWRLVICSHSSVIYELSLIKPVHNGNLWDRLLSIIGSFKRKYSNLCLKPKNRKCNIFFKGMFPLFSHGDLTPYVAHYLSFCGNT